MSHERLAELLTAFARAPGRNEPLLGEPAELYGRLDTVAAWAMGRVPAELAERSGALQKAAVLYVQRACFAAGATHYQVLGFHGVDPAPQVLHTRYRALIRLTHPDMGVQGLPADAAGMVNRAHQVLEDAVQRARYDDELEALAAAPPPRAKPTMALAEIPTRQTLGERWQSLLARYPGLASKTVTVGGLGALGVSLLAWVASGPNETKGLVAQAGIDVPRTAPPRALPGMDYPAAPVAGPAARDQRQPPSLDGGASRAATGMPGAEAGEPERLRLDRSARLAEPKRADSAAQRAEPQRRPAQAEAPTPPEREAAATAPPPVPTAAPMAPVEREPAVVRTAAAEPLPAPPPPVPRPVAVAPAVPSPAPATLQPAPPPPPPAPAPFTTWPVDAGAAKAYLTNTLGTLETRSQAMRTNAYLSDQNVKGTLLQPALPWLRRYPDVRIEQMNWNDQVRSGVLRVQGALVLKLQGAERDDSRRLTFALQAEFWGTRDGTVLGRLDLRELE
jgi:hypothetical protein